jgi:sialic acid synthase SpsE
MLHVIGVEKNSLASALGAQNVERHFALNVMRGVVKVAFDVVGRLKI